MVNSRTVVCLGMKGSASTWMFNAVASVCGQNWRRAPPGGPVIQLYADQEPRRTLSRGSSLIVIKSHAPTFVFLMTIRSQRTSLITTIRDPRDCVASLIERFDYRFETACREVAEQASLILRIQNYRRAIVFKFEDRFFDDPNTLREIARFLGVHTPPKVREDTYRMLRPEAVKTLISKLEGPLTKGFTDPVTQWHSGHVGKGKVGVYRAVLSETQQRQVAAHCAAFGTTYGYFQRDATG
jgi:hypothetical protein